MSIKSFDEYLERFVTFNLGSNVEIRGRPVNEVMKEFDESWLSIRKLLMSRVVEMKRVDDESDVIHPSYRKKYE